MRYRSTVDNIFAIQAMVISSMIIVVFLALVPVIYNSTNYMLNRYIVAGIVQSPPVSKLTLVASENSTSGAQKFAIVLEDRIINCSSTQCAALPVGARVQFSCYQEWNVFVPNEEECRFEKILKNE